MRTRLILGWLVILFLVAAIGTAQEPPARTLSLAEALDIARRNNPDYHSTLNDRGPAAMQLRAATLNLLTPGADLRGSFNYTQGGTRTDFFGFPQAFEAVTTQSYSFGFGYSLSGQTVSARGQASATLRAAEEGISEARTRLETTVRTFYLNALHAVAQQDLARRSLERARENVALAQARSTVGQGTLIEVRRAEVQQGQAEVSLLRATQAVQAEQFRLFQQLGTPKPEGAVTLTDSFPVSEPAWNTEQLVAMARDENPGLRALRARQHSATWGVRSARSQFLPTLNFSAGFSASRTSTQFADSTGAFIPVTQSNRNPWNISVSASLPIYDGLWRNAQVAQARAQEDDLRLAVRARDLQLRTEVVTALQAVQAAWQSIDIQRRNRVASAEALELATQRYRVGSGTYIELLDARVEAERAEADYLTSIYDYHRAIATLENAVGRPLR